MFFVVVLFSILFAVNLIPPIEGRNCVGFRSETAGSIHDILSIPKHSIQCDQCVSYFCRTHHHQYVLGAGCLSDMLNDCWLTRENVGKFATTMHRYTGCYFTETAAFYFCYGQDHCEDDKNLLQCLYAQK